MFQWSLGILPSFRSPRWQPFLVVFFLPILVVVSIGLMNLVTAAAWNKVLNLCFGTGLKDCWRFCKNGLEPSFHSRRTHVINSYYTLLYIYIYNIHIQMTQPAQLGILQNTKFIEPTTYERHTIRYIYIYTDTHVFPCLVDDISLAMVVKYLLGPPKKVPSQVVSLAWKDVRETLQIAGCLFLIFPDIVYISMLIQSLPRNYL